MRTPLFETREDSKHFFNVVLDALFVIADVGAHVQVFHDGHTRKHAAPLGHHGQSLLDQVPGALAAYAFAHVDNVASGQWERSGNGFHGGGLTRTVGADQGYQLAFADFEIHPFDGLDAAIGDLQSAHLEQCVAGHMLSFWAGTRRPGR